MRFSTRTKSESVIHNLPLRMSPDISSTKPAICDPSCAFRHSYTSPRDAAQSFRLMKRCSPFKPHGFNNGVNVTTDRAIYRADKLIIAAGSWVTQFLEPSHARHFKVYRQVMFWFRIRDDLRSQFVPGEFPIFIWILENARENFFYGFP